MHQIGRAAGAHDVRSAIRIVRATSLALALALVDAAGAETSVPAVGEAAPAAPMPAASAPAPNGPSAGAAPASDAPMVAFSAEQEEQLAAAQYVYISSERKDGSLSRPAEIWFFAHDDALWVGSSPKSWRVKRIRWGRPEARIAIGNQSGPSFWARGAIVSDPADQERLMDQFAKKYASGWSRWEESFRSGFKTGDRVLIRYRPIQR